MKFLFDARVYLHRRVRFYRVCMTRNAAILLRSQTAYKILLRVTYHFAFIFRSIGSARRCKCSTWSEEKSRYSLIAVHYDYYGYVRRLNYMQSLTRLREWFASLDSSDSCIFSHSPNASKISFDAFGLFVQKKISAVPGCPDTTIDAITFTRKPIICK